MSRSRRKNPIVGMTSAESEKIDKARAHRRTRRLAAAVLSCGDEPSASIKLTENPWTYAKDGKQWLSEVKPELLRK
jgi:hypothetical protein